eukprot:6187153-Pleurochrysis_carterae.AAC.1
MRVSRPKGNGGKNKGDSDEMLAVTKSSDSMGIAGTPDESPSHEAQELEMKGSAPLSLPARARGFPNSKAVDAKELDAELGEAQSYAKKALAVTSIAEGAVDVRPELPSQVPCDAEAEDSTCARHLANASEILGPEPRDTGRIGVEEEAGIMESANTSDRDKMRDTCVDSPPPRPYIKASLLVVGEGTAVFIISLLAIESQAERERAESTPHSPAEPSALATSPGRGYILGRCTHALSGTAWMAAQSSTPKRTCSRNWLCPSA